MTTLLWIASIGSAYFVFLLLPVLYGPIVPQKARTRRYFYLQYDAYGHSYYWDNKHECWTLLKENASMFRARWQAEAALGFAECYQPEEHEMFEVQIKTATQAI